MRIGESFISLGECVINGKSYQMWTILYQRKGKCHHFQNCNQFLHCYLIWRILLSFFSSILLLFVNLISYYQALTFTHMIYVEITLSNEYMFICFAPSMFVFLNCFATGWCKVSLIALVLSWLHPQVCVFKWVLKLWASADAKSHLLHLFGFTGLLCVFKCLFKLNGRDAAKSHWLHLYDFLTLCVFKWVLKLPAWMDAKSHWLHLFDFSPLWVLKCLPRWLAEEDA